MKLFNIFCNKLILQKLSSYQKEIKIGRSCYEFYLVLITKDCFQNCINRNFEKILDISTKNEVGNTINKTDSTNHHDNKGLIN